MGLQVKNMVLEIIEDTGAPPKVFNGLTMWKGARLITGGVLEKNLLLQK